MGNSESTKPKSRKVAYLLWLFFGWIGIHRLYLRKFKSGILMMILGIILIYINRELFLYVLVNIAFVAIEGSLQTFLLSIPLYFFAFISTSFIFLILWWFFDLIFIYIDTAQKNE